MPGKILTRSSTIMCPHGGQANLITTNSKTSANRSLALLESDIHTVAGCTFTAGSKPSPCLRIEWSSGASKVTVDGTKVLVQSSIGKCLNSEGADQGVATIVNTQQKVSGQ
jgi:hypothetical protein